MIQPTDVHSSARLIGDPLIILDSVDSSNNYAMGQVNKGMAREGTAYFARKQTAGKGQRGKSWISSDSQNIILSVVLQPVMISPDQQFLLSAAVALAGCDLLMAYAGPAECTIKWSNDLYWRDRKAGGILIENVLRGGVWSYAVAGIGMNINQLDFPADLPNPVSLARITGRSWDLLPLVREFCVLLNDRYLQLRSGEGGRILEDYTQRLFRLNEPALYQTANGQLSGVIRGVETDGRLRMETSGKMVLFGFGELEFIR